MLKKMFQLAVIALLGVWLLSMLGCGHKRAHLQDGPGMERSLWQDFSIWQNSDVYEQNFSYTVKYDEASNVGILYVEKPDEQYGYPVEKSIELGEETVSALYNLDLMSLPNDESKQEENMLDGTVLYFSVTDQQGKVQRKVITEEKGEEILELITPYANKLNGE